MATSAPMLPGLGGGTGGVQLAPGQLANAGTAKMTTQNAAAAQSSGSVAVPPAPTTNSSNNFSTQGNTILGNVPGTSMPISPTAVPTNLPQPNVTAPNALQMPPGGALPAGLTPMATPTQIMNTPQQNTPAEFAAKFGASATTPDQTANTADKYNAAFKAVKNTTAPTNGGESRSMVQTALDKNTPAAQTNPVGDSIDAYASMSPVIKNMFDTLNTLISSQSSKQSLVEQFQKMEPDPGVATLTQDQLNLMNIKNVMNGTEDDIRNEITKAGGFATNSQVLALTASRNKVLQQQESSLQNTIQMKEDYVSQIMQLTQADQKEVDSQVSQQLGLDEKIADMQESLDNATTQNLQALVKNLGYQGLAASFQGNPQGMAQAEQLLGLPQGALLNPAFLAMSSLGTNTVGQFTLSPGAERFDANGNVIASVPATGAGGTPGSGSSDPYVQSWVSNVLNGNATMAQVPSALRNEVALSMANASTADYSPLAASRFTMAANRIVSNYINLPQYQLTANGLPYLQRIQAAETVPGSVSDQDLLDSLTKLNSSGNAVSDAQVAIITNGKSFSDAMDVWKNYLQNGGVLSDNQRQEVQQVAQAIFANYSKGYQPVYDQAVSQLQAAGIPKAFWTIPDLNNLAGTSVTGQTTDASGNLPGLGGSSVGNAPQFPNSLSMTNFQTVNGVLYAQGTDGNYHPF